MEEKQVHLYYVVRRLNCPIGLYPYEVRHTYPTTGEPIFGVCESLSDACSRASDLNTRAAA